MKLWLISQEVNDGYDTYDSAVVAAETAEAAQHTHPSPLACAGWGEVNGRLCWRGQYCCPNNPAMHERLYDYGDHSWSAPECVSVEVIGEAAPGVVAGPICASFNAG